MGVVVPYRLNHFMLMLQFNRNLLLTEMKEMVMVVRVTGVSMQHHYERPFLIAIVLVPIRDNYPCGTSEGITNSCRRAFLHNTKKRTTHGNHRLIL